MSYKPTVPSPGYRSRDAKHGTPTQACIVCKVNEDGTVNLLTFDGDCNAFAVKGAVVVQADEDGCPCHYSDPEPEPLVHK